MIEVAPNLFVGNQLDYENKAKGKDWAVVQACKEPYHRQALGNYKGMGAPRDHKEYLFAYRQDGDCRRLILNMVDAPKPEFFADAMVEEAMTFLSKCMSGEFKTLIHCNQGGSRAPSLALLYLRRNDPEWMSPELSFEEAEDMFRGLYPPYDPAAGIRAYVENHWGDTAPEK